MASLEGLVVRPVEHPVQLVVRRPLVEFQGANAPDEVAQAFREPAAKVFVGRRLLDAKNVLVLVGLLVVGPNFAAPSEAHPRDPALGEVNEDVGQRFEVVAAALLDAQMGVDGREPWRAGEAALLVLVLDVLAVVDVLLARPKSTR